MQLDDDHLLLTHYAQDRSQAAFAELIERHVDMVYSTALRIVGDSHLAEDVSQAVFLTLSDKAAHLSPRAIVGGWLYHVTCLTARNARRSEMRRQRREAAAAAAQCSAGTAPATSSCVDVDAALAKLKRSDRDVLVLRYLEDRSPDQIARQMGLSKEATAKRLTRGLARLRRILSPGATFAATGLINPAPDALRTMINSMPQCATQPVVIAQLARSAVRALMRARIAMAFKLASLAALIVVLTSTGIGLMMTAPATTPTTRPATNGTSLEITMNFPQVMDRWWIDPVANHYTRENDELIIENHDANNAALHAELGGMSWDDYRVKIEFLVETETSEPVRQIGGFPWNVQLCPSNTNIFCQIFGDGAVNIGYVYDFDHPGDWRHLSDRRINPPPLNEWQTLTLTARQGHVTISLDGEQLNEADVPGGTAGMCGLLINFASDARVRVRNIEATLLDPTAEQRAELDETTATNWANYKRRRAEQAKPVEPREFPANKPGMTTTLPPEVKPR